MKIVGYSLVDQTVVELRRRIIRGDLPEGTPLRQEALATELGISRVPLREAIRQLEAEGFVTSQVHKGAVVSTLSLEEIEELFEIRMRIETWLFEVAIPRLTESELDEADALTDEAARTGRVENWAELNWKFHEILYKPSGNKIALRLLKTVHDNAARYINLQIAVMVDVERELTDHRTLVAYARLRDAKRGAELLRGHIRRVSRTLIASLTERRNLLRDVAC